MATFEARTTTTKNLAEGSDASSLSSNQAESQSLMDDDGDVVSGSKNKRLNSDDGGVKLAKNKVFLGGEEGKGKQMDSALGCDKEKGNSVQEIGNDSNGKEIYNGNGISLVVEVVGSLARGKENKKFGSIDDKVFSDDDESVGSPSEKLSEINSSVSKAGINHDITKEKGDVKAIEDDDEDVGDQDDNYCVGDFVWGKIRSYPWWPGQIYDPSDASDYAAKYKQKGRLLVAYFGDGSFSWCKSSQLKSFIENFEELSKQSNSKSFVNAVQKALDEVSRIVELEMNSSYVSEENQIRVARHVNRGIKKGVLAPVGGIGKFLIARQEAKGLLSSLRTVAQATSANNLLDFTVLKSWLTGYYSAKGGYPLSIYQEPKGIEGLEDKNRNGVLSVEIPIQGDPPEEECFSSPVAVGPKMDQSNQSLLQKCQAIPGEKLYQRRKKKSIAELMDSETKDKKGCLVKGTKSNKLTSGIKKSRGNTEAEKQDKSLMTSGSGMKGEKKRKVQISAVSPRTLGKKISSAETAGVGDEESKKTHLSRELKNKKRSSVEIVEDEAIENGESLTPRERKKSRYLSPPYTNPTWRMRSSGYDRTDSRVGERMTKVASQLIGLHTIKNGGGGQIFPKELGSRHEATSKELLYDLRASALDPLCLSEKIYLDFITEYFSEFRNSTFSEGSTYDELYQRAQTGPKNTKG